MSALAASHTKLTLALEQETQGSRIIPIDNGSQGTQMATIGTEETLRQPSKDPAS